MDFEDFVSNTKEEYERIQENINEIDVLVKQSSAEVERLSQSNSQLTTYVRQLDIETAPREDIKDGYDRLLNMQQRLFTMRGQLEKLQADQRSMQKMSENLENVLRFSSGGNFSGGASASDGPDTQYSEVIRVIETEEMARQTLVRKMHDGPASSLSNFILQAEICEKLFDSDPDKARTELNTLKTAAASTFGKVKDFIFDLRPMMLDDLGVVPTLRSWTSSVEGKSGTDISLTVTGIEQRLESHVEVTIFRSVQELVNNAMTHGQATQIKVFLDLTPALVKCTVEDNGGGFTVDETMFSKASSFAGLKTMRERVAMLDGNLDIQSGVAQGTKIEFSIPIQSGFAV
ncbi:MAG: sensor histidine kinase [Chloroflexota bacterium]